MNNLQLAILLDKYAKLFWQAFTEIKGELPEELGETKKHFEQEYTYHAILAPLERALWDLDSDVERLQRDASKPATIQELRGIVRGA